MIFYYWSHTLQLCWTHLLLLIKFSIYKIMLLVSRHDFTSFPVWVPFISFSSLIALVRSSSIVLSRSQEVDILSCSWSQKENFQYFVLKYMIFAVIVVRITFMRLFFLVCWVFYYERILDFIICFFCICGMVLWFFIPIIECIMLIDFHVKLVLHFLDDSV